MAKEKAAFAAGKKIATGDFSRAHLMAIIQWKSPRPTRLIASNGDEEIADALRVAVSARTTRTAVAVLCGLRGVHVPAASAILTMIDPERYTVIDVRALETLGTSRPSPSVDDYLEYLEFCRAKAKEHSVTLRDFDRALWQSSKNISGRPTSRA